MKGLVRKDLKLLVKMDNRIFVIVPYAFAISNAYFEMQIYMRFNPRYSFLYF